MFLDLVAHNFSELLKNSSFISKLASFLSQKEKEGSLTEVDKRDKNKV